MLYTITISITTVIQTHLQMQNTGGLGCFRYEWFIIFWLRFMETRGERHNSYYANHPQRAAHLVIFKISVSRDLKNPTTSSTAQIQVSRQWQKLNSLPPWSNLNSQLTLFQNPQILRIISSGHDVIHTPAHFLSGVYYDNGDCHILCTWA